jgi:hypothetical protein
MSARLKLWASKCICTAAQWRVAMQPHRVIEEDTRPMDWQDKLVVWGSVLAMIVFACLVRP